MGVIESKRTVTELRDDLDWLENGGRFSRCPIDFVIYDYGWAMLIVANNGQAERHLKSIGGEEVKFRSVLIGSRAWEMWKAKLEGFTVK